MRHPWKAWVWEPNASRLDATIFLSSFLSFEAKDSLVNRETADPVSLPDTRHSRAGK
jgi:hypothetical protein